MLGDVRTCQSTLVQQLRVVGGKELGLVAELGWWWSVLAFFF